MSERARSRARPRLLVCLLVLVLPAAACGRGDAPGPALPPDVGVVTHVVDGDTLRLRLAGGRRETVRLIGIDTPESVHPTKPVGCFGREAARRLHALAPPGTQLRLERDVELRDHYRRLLVYAFRRRDGLFLNEALARDGFARTARYPPNEAYAERLVDAVTEARAAERGLWHACAAAERAPP